MTRWALALFAAVLVAGTGPAQNKPEDVITRAIDAHGGSAVLKKYPAGTSKIAGKVIQGKDELPFTGAVAFALPGKVRVEMTFEVAGQKASTVQVVNGDKVSQTENGRASNPGAAATAELRESAMIQELSLLYPLLDAAKYTVAADKDATADGRECAVVVVKAKGLKETKLFFDKKTGQLAAMQRRGLNPTQQPVDELTTFSDYKTISGMVVPMKSKVSHDGKPFLEIAVSEYKPADKLDDKLFATE